MEEMVRNRDSNVEEAIGGLVGLAFIRQVAEGLENIEIGQDSQYVTVQAAVDFNFVYAALGTVGIAQIGQEVERFQDIANELTE